MANKKNKTAITVICVVIGVLILAAAVALFFWARSLRSEVDGSDTTGPAKIEENTLVNTDTSDLPADDTDVETEPVVPYEEPDEDLTIDNATSSDSVEADGGTAYIKMDYPVLTSSTYGENVDRFNELISTELDSFKNAFVLAATGEDDKPGKAVNYTLSYTVYKSSYGVVSLLFNENRDGAVTCKAVNFELNGGAVITLDSVVVAGQEAYEPVIKSLILEQMKADPGKYLSTADNALDGVFKKEQFLMTNAGIMIFFQPGDITADGSYAEFELKYADLRTLMAY